MADESALRNTAASPNDPPSHGNSMQNTDAGRQDPAMLDPNAWLQRELSGGSVAPLRRHPADNRRAPGWFDSSWELQRGLVVSESLPDDVDLDRWFGAHAAR